MSHTLVWPPSSRILKMLYKPAKFKDMIFFKNKSDLNNFYSNLGDRLENQIEQTLQFLCTRKKKSKNNLLFSAPLLEMIKKDESSSQKLVVEKQILVFGTTIQKRTSLSLYCKNQVSKTPKIKYQQDKNQFWFNLDNQIFGFDCVLQINYLRFQKSPSKIFQTDNFRAFILTFESSIKDPLKLYLMDINNQFYSQTLDRR